MLKEEIEWVIITHPNSGYSHHVIMKCMEYNVSLLFCDKKHSPTAIIASEYGHSQKVKRLQDQLALSSKTRNRLWRKIVMGKINNQSTVLSECTDKTLESQTIKLIGKQVQEGDSTYRESYASRLYFRELFGEGFKRGRYKDPVNASLNYGYVILRSLIRQELVMHGLEPSLGINHQSNENPFNLSDDIIEAFRPFVDTKVYENIYVNKVSTFTTDIKKDLFELFLDKCVLNGKVYALLDAIKEMIRSYIKCLEKNSAAPLQLPSLIEGGK